MNKIKAYVMRVQGMCACKGTIEVLEDKLCVYQDIVGGTISALSIDENIEIILNDEGKLLELQPNRAVIGTDGVFHDVLVGNLIAVRHLGENFADIQEEDLAIINKILKPYMLGFICIDDNPELPEYVEEEND